MASQDIKGAYNGAYSYQYQTYEQERYQRLKEEQLETTRSIRDRAHQLSKQTIQRKKALEQKKLAMAKAEEDRRRKALEERHKQQQEATDRFRSAIYRTIKPTAGKYLVKTYHDPMLESNRSNGIDISRKTTNKKWSETKRDRIVLGHNVDIMSTATLEDVLETIRGRKSANVNNSFQAYENHKLSNEVESLSQTSIQETTPTPPTIKDIPLSTNEIVTSTDNKFLFPVSQNTSEEKMAPDTLEESILSSSSESFHDSLDSPNSPSQSTMSQSTPSQSTPSQNIPSQVISTSLEQDSPTLEVHEMSTNESNKEIRRPPVGILKKTVDAIDIQSINNSDISVLSTYKKSQNTKHVRFKDDVTTTTSDHLLTSPNAMPKMKISLARKGKNGIIRSQSDSDDIHSVSPQLLTLPVDKTVLSSDEDVNTLWSQINAYFYQTRHTDGTPLTNKVYSTPQLSRGVKPHPPFKLWRRHALQQTDDQSRQHSPQLPASSSYVHEESRLLESIELLNERLKWRAVAMETNDHLDGNRKNRSSNELSRNKARYHPKVLQTTKTLQYR